MHSNILTPDETALVIVDVQNAFRDAIPDFSDITARIAIAVRGFSILGLPIVITEQYPKGLGRTADEILAALPADHDALIEKSTFSSCGTSDFLIALNRSGARQIALCGVETHVCVNQTAHDLLDAGFQVHLLTDAIGSRAQRDRDAGLQKMIRSGAIVSTVEMALFELLEDSRNEHFKAVQALVR